MKARRLVSRSRNGAAIAVMALVAAAACATGGGGGGSRGAAASAGQSAAACPSPGTDPAQVVDVNRPAQDPQLLQGVGAGLCLTEVLNRLGPAHRYVASGVFQFEWKATDGRTYQVGIPSMREKTVYARWSK